MSVVALIITIIHAVKLKKIAKQFKFLGVRDNKLQDIGEIVEIGSDVSRRILKLKVLSILTCILFIVDVVITIVVIIVMNTLVNQIESAASAYAILNRDDAIEEMDEENDIGWEFGRYVLYHDGDEWVVSDKGIGLDNPTGGLMPTNTQLRNRALYINLLHEVCDYNRQGSVVEYEPMYLIGTFFRESGNTQFTMIDAGTDKDILKDLYYLNPVCTKGSKCRYVQNGHSHFIGGEIVNGVDTGDPKTQKIDEDVSKYLAAGKDHAIGIPQFEARYISSWMGSGNDPDHIYKNIEASGFYRPNIFFYPDMIQSVVVSEKSKANTWIGQSTTSLYAINQNSNFKSLSDRNRQFIQIYLLEVAYKQGNMKMDGAGREPYEIAVKLVELVKSGKIVNLDEMLNPIASRVYNSSNRMIGISKSEALKYIRDNYGISPSDSSSGALASVTIGPVYYRMVVKDIADSTKSGGSSGSDSGIGTTVSGRDNNGKFKNSGSLYYHEGLGIRYYGQTPKSCSIVSGPYDWIYRELKTNTDSGKGKDKATLQSGGCGWITAAIIISNMVDKDITPDQLLDYAYSTGMSFTSYMPKDHIQVYMRNYGVPCSVINISGMTDSSFEKKIVEELDKGRLIMFSADGSDGKLPWYGGEGHFLAIRDYKVEGGVYKFAPITSAGRSNGTSALNIMNTYLPASGIRKYIKHNTVWSCG